MNWLQRLNLSLAPTPGQPAILHWAYNPHLTDNVPHRHTYFEICLVGDYGAGIFTCAGQRYEIGPGKAFFARPGVIHQIQNTQTPLMELFWVAFSVPKLAGEVGALWDAFAASDLSVVHDDGRLKTLWNGLRLVAEAPEIAGKDAQIEALSNALLLSMAQMGVGEAVPTAQLRQFDTDTALAKLAVRYMQDNLARHLEVAEVAAHVHLSPRHFARVFRAFAGTSPAAYLETARMDRARQLLLHSGRSLKEISAAVGFGDVHHFSRVFSRFHGCAPGQFRKNPTLFKSKIENSGDLV